MFVTPAGTTSAVDGQTMRQQRAGPVYMLASATETGMPAYGAPAWRVALGNMAAGATAGAVVEAGALQRRHACILHDACMPLLAHKEGQSQHTCAHALFAHAHSRR